MSPLGESGIDKDTAYLVFHVDATRQAARQRTLPCDPTLPSLANDEGAVCAPGFTRRKRGEVVRTRTVALQMHTRQWIGTYAGRGNGDYQGKLDSALRAITTYLEFFTLPTKVALVRLDGQYGDAVAVTLLIEADMHLVTRARGYPRPRASARATSASAPANRMRHPGEHKRSG